MKPVFLEVIGTDNKKYRINVAQVLYYYAFEKKGSLLTEIVFSNKGSIESEETPSEIDARITQLLNEGQQDHNGTQPQHQPFHMQNNS
jgi:hypothetical protein